MEKVESLQVEYRIRKRLADLPEIISRYAEWLRLTKKTQTVLEYIKDVGLFVDFMKEKNIQNAEKDSEYLTRLTSYDIKEFLFNYIPKHEKVYERLNGKEVRQEFGNSEKSQRRKLSALRSLSRFLIEAKIVKEDVCIGIELNRVDRGKHSYLDIHSKRLLLDAIETYSEDDFQRIRNQLITLLFLSSGIKTSELLALNLQDIFLKKRMMRIESRKEAEQWITLDKKVCSLMKKYLQLRDEKKVPIGWHQDALFISIRNKRLNRRTIHYIYQRYEKLASFKERLTPQLLRNTFAKETLLKEKDIKRLSNHLGNKDVYATKRLYATDSFKNMK